MLPAWFYEFFSRKPKLSEALAEAVGPTRSISPPPQSYVDADNAFHAKMASLAAANTAREKLQNDVRLRRGPVPPTLQHQLRDKRV